MKKLKRTPSRTRYEKSHPTVSFRISKELDDALQAVKKTEGLSNADVMKKGVGLIKVKVRAEKEIRDKAFEEGLENGFERAAEVYEVKYSCSICGREITVSTEKEKTAIRQFMQEKGWAHGECLERKNKK